MFAEVPLALFGTKYTCIVIASVMVSVKRVITLPQVVPVISEVVYMYMVYICCRDKYN